MEKTNKKTNKKTNNKINSKVNSKIEKEINNKIKELAEYLGVSINEITTTKNDMYECLNYHTPKGKYMIFTEEESFEALKRTLSNIFNTKGFEVLGSLLNDFIKKYCIDDIEMKELAWNEQAYIVKNTLTAKEIVERAIDNYVLDKEDLLEKCVEMGIIDKGEVDIANIYDYLYIITDNIDKFSDYDIEDLKNELIEGMVDGILKVYTNYAEWYVNKFGVEALDRVYVLYNNIVDFDEAASWCLWLNNYGNWLSDYDGKTIELSNYYAYRIK